MPIEYIIEFVTFANDHPQLLLLKQCDGTLFGLLFDIIIPLFLFDIWYVILQLFGYIRGLRILFVLLFSLSPNKYSNLFLLKL